ncbi:MAG: L-aspartate oxidase [Clostridia bacterium]|nr:L-aspartate oxidase [Clostridia bacterium]
MERKEIRNNVFQTEYDVLIVGAGVAGMNCAMHLSAESRILMISKGGIRESDSYLAQGGICVLRDEEDFDGYFEDTMRAGHYENDPATVRCMIENSRDTINALSGLGVRFERDNHNSLLYTREGAHSRSRIVYHADCTGKEIASHMLKEVKKRENVEILSHATMLDLITEENRCLGAVVRINKTGELLLVKANAVVLATGGVGGLYRHSTNFRTLTGDGVAVALRHGVKVEHPDYVQFHPTTLYSKGRGRKFLISESVRGEGARLIDSKGERFVNELLPRDVVTEAIRKKMAEEGSEFVRLDLSTVKGGEETLNRHFPSIMRRCKKEGYDILREPVPVVPAQHYFMGGVKSDLEGRTSMKNLYAVGETCCNGVHGKNRLASNSLLEAIIFAKRAAEDIAKSKNGHTEGLPALDLDAYFNYRKRQEEDKKAVRRAIENEDE